MSRKRRSHSAEFKFRVALEALKGMKTVTQIAQESGIHPNLVRAWKRQLMEGGREVFARERRREEQEWQRQEEALYEQIGRLQMELNWLKKKAARFS